MDNDLTHMRRAYERTELREENVSADPILQLSQWVGDAIEAGSPEANAMCLCTVAEDWPSARFVLLRGLDERGLVFFTSYFSRKGRELGENPHAAAVMYWPQLERQVRIEGVAAPLSDEESDAYFAGRPRGHQIGAWASEQSEPVESRDVLDQRVEDYAARFEGEPVPRPHSWGGYVLRPERIEFWQGRPNRVHDRLEFTRSADEWAMRRLQP